MTSIPNTTIPLLGLSGTGKTTFLVALDVVLDDQTDKNGLVHSGLAADRVYLQPLREKWLRGEELEHTSRQIPPPPHQLLVQHQASNTVTGFDVPDLAGETFDSQFETRSFSREFGAKLKHATGLLLFLHCDGNAAHEILNEPALIDSATSDNTASERAEDIEEWVLSNASQQTKLVDLLQFIAELRPLGAPMPVSVIISAWDRVEKLPDSSAAEMPKKPLPFLQKKWPLLFQFLSNNSGKFGIRVFGVSARGGGSDPVEVKRLTRIKRPSERVLVVDDSHRSNDITRPVQWVLGLLPITGSTDA